MGPLLEIPVCLAGNDDLKEKIVTARISPDNLHGYYPGYHWGAILILSGHTLLTTLSCEEIDAALQQYRVMLRHRKINSGNLQIKTEQHESN